MSSRRESYISIDGCAAGGDEDLVGGKSEVGVVELLFSKESDPFPTVTGIDLSLGEAKKMSLSNPDVSHV
ncbi:hypothetical protein ACFX2I_028014 [Malus domestica]